MAAGVLLWSMLTGLRPWNRMSRVQVIVNICIQKKTLDVPAGLPKDLGVRCAVPDVPVNSCLSAATPPFAHAKLRQARVWGGRACT